MLEATIHRPRGFGGSRASTLIHGPNRSTKYVYGVPGTRATRMTHACQPPPDFPLTIEGISSGSLIRESNFGKSRLVPLQDNTLQALNDNNLLSRRNKSNVESRRSSLPGPGSGCVTRWSG